MGNLVAAVVVNTNALPVTSDLLKEQALKIALNSFLDSKTERTRANYKSSLKQFLEHTGSNFIDATIDNVVLFTQRLKEQGASDATINARLAALSSFFEYLKLPHLGGQPLINHNPVQIKRPKVSMYGRARRFDLELFKMILGEIYKDQSEAGKRAKALLLLFVFCGNRNAESKILLADIWEEAGEYFFKFKAKGNGTRTKNLPLPVYIAIKEYVEITGRNMEVDKGAVFLQTTRGLKAKSYLDQYYGRRDLADNSGFLSSQSVLGIVKKYAKKALRKKLSRHTKSRGKKLTQVVVDKLKLVSIHGLRALSARLRLDAGCTLPQIRAHLGHSSLATTEIYLQTVVDIQKDKHWQAVEEMLGLGQKTDLTSHLKQKQ